jgi:hypothetical protein
LTCPEQRFYRKIRDLYALSVDYDPKAEQEYGRFTHRRLAEEAERADEEFEEVVKKFSPHGGKGKKKK